MANNHERVAKAMSDMPLVAILRGLLPENAKLTGQTLVDAGFKMIEVPLNSPEPFESIRILRESLGDDIVIGAGTVVQLENVQKLADAGGEIVVTPNTNPDIIRASIELGMVPMPGFGTPTEAFAAASAGAKYLKLFPANMFPIEYVKGLLSVLPKDVNLLAVGGADETNGAEFFAAGFSGLGLGSCLFKPQMSQADIARKAEQLVAVVKGL